MTVVTALPKPGTRTVWFSPENPDGARGGGGLTGGGRKGRPCVTVPAGDSLTLAECATGVSGTVRRVWLTFPDRTPEMLRGVVIEAWWDGSAKPAISAPLGDFFGHMCGRMSAFESVYFGSPEARSFWTILPMPFRDGMRLRLANTTERDLHQLYYEVDCTTGEPRDADTGYIHAVARRENPTTLRRDFEILPTITGHGRFLGAHIGVEVDGVRYGKTWWGEGELKIYLDGDHANPSLVGTGTEDYLGTGWGQGRFAGLYAGAPLEDDAARAYGFYRWHVPDPVYFHESLRVTIQQIGHCFGENRVWLRERAAATGEPVYVAGAEPVVADLSDAGSPDGVLFERQDDWSSVAYFLLDRP